MGSPLISVLIASYNPGPYLRPSLASILSQTHANLEVILVDDGSSDGSVADRFILPAHDATGLYRLSAVGDMRFDTDLAYVEGFDYVLRVGELFPVAVVGECLYTYRIHPESITKRSPRERDDNVRQLLRKACERRGDSYVTE